MESQVINSNKAPAAIGPYSQGIRLDNLIFVSGQLPIDPATGELVEGVEGQARQSLLNLKAILEEAGSSLNKVVKTTIFLKNMEDFAQVNQIYAQFFVDQKPARSCVAVRAIPKDALLEIECIAYK